MVIAFLLFLLGMVFLIKGGDWFVDGAVGIAHRFRMPEFLIGATVVSVGTTVPEVMVSTNSALQGNGGIAYGNAIGSIICNTALIAAITIAARPSAVKRKSILLPVVMFYIAAALYTEVSYTGGYFGRGLGILLLVIFAVYITLSISQARFKEQAAANLMETEADPPAAKKDAAESKPARLLVHELGLLVVGAAVIAVGADLLVDNGTLIAQGLGVPDSVIALTMVALGTSLPELITAITSLNKNCGDLSLGNVIGANLFNLVLVCGLSMTLAPFSLPAGKIICGMNSSLVVEIPVMLLVMLIMTVPALLKEKLYRWQGVLLLGIYALFCVYQFAA